MPEAHDLSDFKKLREELEYWQFFYNWQRPHGSLGGKPPSQIISDLIEKTPFWDQIVASYDSKKERIKLLIIRMIWLFEN